MFRSISWCLPALAIITFLFPVSGLLPGGGQTCEGAEAKLTPEEIIHRALDKPVTLEAIETPLEDVTRHLAAQAGLPNLKIDTRALEDVGIGSDTPITWNLKGISLRNVLQLVLRELDLTFMIRDDVLLITTPEEAETRLRVQIFDVVDLVRFYDDAPPEEYDYDTLIELISSTVAPTTWADAGGSGSIGGFRGTLVVSQTQQVLDEIAPLLDTVRKARQITREHGTQTPPITSLLVGPPRVEAIDRALLKKASCDFQETPLQDVVDFLQKTFEIPILIDLRAAEDMGIGRDTPITFSATDLPLRHALRLLLRQLDLTYMQYRSVLLITTPEEAEATLETRIYPVGDLLGGLSLPPAGGHVNFDRGDYDALIELTTSATAPVTWWDTGGPGSIESLPAFGLCVVSQTQEAHEEVEQLFARLRQTIPRKRLAEQQEDGSGLRLVVYFVGTKSATAPEPAVDAAPKAGKAPNKADTSQGRLQGNQVLAQVGGAGSIGGGLFEDEELLELLIELVEPASWQAEGVYARATAGRLIIRQTDDVHRKIRRMLGRLGVGFFETINGPPRFMGNALQGMGGMGGGGMGGMGGGGGFF